VVPETDFVEESRPFPCVEIQVLKRETALPVPPPIVQVTFVFGLVNEMYRDRMGSMATSARRLQLERTVGDRRRAGQVAIRTARRPDRGTLQAELYYGVVVFGRGFSVASVKSGMSLCRPM
jgi:hypothetical protein